MGGANNTANMILCARKCANQNTGFLAVLLGAKRYGSFFYGAYMLLTRFKRENLPSKMEHVILHNAQNMWHDNIYNKNIFFYICNK